MDFSRKEYWSGFPFPTPGDLPDPEIKLNISVSPELAYKNYVHYVFHTNKIKMQNYAFRPGWETLFTGSKASEPPEGK